MIGAIDQRPLEPWTTFHGKKKEVFFSHGVRVSSLAQGTHRKIERCWLLLLFFSRGLYWPNPLLDYTPLLSQVRLIAMENIYFEVLFILSLCFSPD